MSLRSVRDRSIEIRLVNRHDHRHVCHTVQAQMILERIGKRQRIDVLDGTVAQERLDDDLACLGARYIHTSPLSELPMLSTTGTPNCCPARPRTKPDTHAVAGGDDRSCRSESHCHRCLRRRSLDVSTPGTVFAAPPLHRRRSSRQMRPLFRRNSIVGYRSKGILISSMA